MRSSVEITAPMVAKLPDTLYRASSLTGIPTEQKFTAYHFTQTYSESGQGRYKDSTGNKASRNVILPFMTRLQSPVRVTRNSDVTGKERSRVSEQTRSAIFNYKPLKRRDQPFLISRLRAPEATSTTSWMSVTKTDFGHPNSKGESSDAGEDSIKTENLRRSFTDLGLIQNSKDSGSDKNQAKPTTVTELTKQSDKSEPQIADSTVPSEQSKQETSVKSVQTEKRVTIVDPAKSSSMPTLNMVGLTKPALQPVIIKDGKGAVAPTYYNGYLPPENSVAIAERLRIRPSSEGKPMNRQGHRIQLAPTCYHKPLVGDRSAFMGRDKHRVYRPHIGQIYHQNGQAPGHFSAYKERHTGPSTKSKKPYILETIRHQQQQQGLTGNRSTLHKTPTAIELYERQREKTYHIKNIVEERLKK